MRNGRRILAGAATAAALGLVVPAVAAADELAGLREGPMQFWAEGNDQCEVTFTIVNYTSSRSYGVDYIIDDEEPSGPTWNFGTVNGVFIGERTMGRLAVRAEAERPTWEDDNKYVRDREPVTSTTTVDLRTLDDLPNPAADAHTITYQAIIGPDGKDKGGFPIFETTVSGCAEHEPDTGSAGSTGSLGSAGSLGSVWMKGLFAHFS